MNWKILGSPAFARVEVHLEPGEALITESDAMISMSSVINMKAVLNGGLIGGLLKKYLGQESLFISKYTNEGQESAHVVISQAWPGDVRCVELKGETLYLQPGSFLACTPGIRLGLGYAGISSFIGKEGLFKLKVSGEGHVWFGGFGGVLEKTLTGDYLVDTSHLLAYEPGIKLKIRLAGGIFSSLFGGEGLVTKLEGNGRIWMQTRSPDSMTSFVNPRL